MKLSTLIKILQGYTPLTDYEVMIESGRLIITKLTDVDEIDVNERD